MKKPGSVAEHAPKSVTETRARAYAAVMAKSLSSFLRALGLVAALIPSACSQDAMTGPRGEHALGQAVYEKPLSDGNSFACGTCHALHEPSADGLRRPAHPIGGATRRSRWKNGKASTFLDAVNSCVTEWMVAPAWSATEPRFVALRDFLDAQTPAGSAADLDYEIVPPPSDVKGGDAMRGKSTFNQSCVLCHGRDGLGTIRGPKVAGSIRLPEYVAGRIRLSGSQTSSVYIGLTGGVMPFWAKDRLSDAEVKDLVAFVTAPVDLANMGGGGTSGTGIGGAGGLGGSGGSAGGSANAGNGGGSTGGGDASGGTGGAGGAGSGCGKTNPRVGWSADLGINTGEGQVSGFVTMVDDCTLELRDFSYDGNGIDVRVYGAKDVSFKPAFTMGPNIVGRTFSKETWRVSLPDGKTLGDLGWVGIWCVAVGANFGSGPFAAP
jgi:mono/diheme cytochrome c family protein